MTVFVYVNTSKQVGDPDHIKVFANVNRRGKMVRGERPRRGSLRICGSGVSRIGRHAIMCRLLEPNGGRDL
jgi:hypothetical protein